MTLKNIKIKILFFLLLTFHLSLSAQDIHEATKAGNLRTLKVLLKENSALVNTTDETGRTPLHWACLQPNSKLISFLIDKGADVNALDHNTVAPLHSLAETDNSSAAKLIIKNGGDINIKNAHGEMPLHVATSKGSLKVAKMLVAEGSDIEALNNYGRTPFITMARESGNIDMAKYLLSKGANINTVDQFGSTALTLTAWRGFSEVNDLLIEGGAELPSVPWRLGQLLRDAVSKKLESLFHMLVQNDMDLSIKSGQGGSLLHLAAGGGSVAIIQALIDHGFDINETDYYGWTPLHYAVEMGREEAINLLIEKGADINARTSIGQSALNIAEEYKYESGNPIGLLTKKNADRSPVEFPEVQGEYFGQEKPGDTPVLFAPTITAGHFTLHSTPVFSPDGQDALWSIQTPPRGPGYGSGFTLHSRIENGQWTQPQRASFNIEHRADVPFFHPNGQRLYYISRGPLHDGEEGGKENIWYMEKQAGKWVNPTPLGQNINALDVHWQLSVDREGNLFFNDNYAKFSNGVYEKPIKTTEAFSNNNLKVDQPFISPDGDYLIYSTFLQNGNGVDLFISFRKEDGSWTDGANLGTTINTRGHEICPIITTDGKYFFFLRNNMAYWVDAGFIEELRPKQ